MAGVGTTVYGSDYNAVQIKVRQVLGDGYPYGPLLYGTASQQSYGWGQPLTSTLVNPSDIVTQAQFNALITDVNTAYLHENNSNISVALHTPISYADLQTLDTYANTILASKNSVNGAQQVQDPIPTNGRVTVGSVWGQGNSYVRSFAHTYFNSDAEMQYFFNQGSTIDIHGIGPGTVTTQDTSWDTLLNGINLHIDLATFNSMSTTAMTQIALYTASNPLYGTNTVQISGIRFSNFLAFGITFTDGHVASGGSPADYVASGAGYNVRWTRSTGAFTGTSPDVYAGQFTLSTQTKQGGFTAAVPGPIPQYDTAGAVFTHSITKNIQHYNLYYMMLAHGWPGNATAQNATITLNSNVYLWANQPASSAIRFDNITGGTINLINNGYIMGRGGNGGTAITDETGLTTVGGNGSTAIQLGAINVTIQNTNGYILGGGGGGGAAGFGTVGSSEYHYGGGGGGAGGGRGGAGYSSAAYLSSAIAISPSGTSTNASFALVLPGASGSNGGTGAAAPSGGSGGRTALALANLTGPSGTTLVPGYGGSAGGTGGIWGGPLNNLSATGGYGGVIVAGQNAPTLGGNGSSTAGSPGSLGTGGGGSWGAAGGAGSYNGAAGSSGGTAGSAVALAGRTVTWTGGFIATRTFGAVA